jgi:tetratricopeptide (TPR) repeat protein
MLRLGDSGRAANNLALRLITRREFARAETLYRASARIHPETQRLALPNLLTPLIYQQKFSEVESLLAMIRPRFPQNAGVRRTHVMLLYHKGDVAGYRRAVDSVFAKGDTLDRRWSQFRIAELALFDGRLKDFTRQWRELQNRDLSDPEERLYDALDLPNYVRMELLDQREAVIRELDAALVAAAPKIRPEEWPYFDIFDLYQSAGQSQRARQWLNRYDAEVKDTFRLREETNGRLRSQADVLMDEGKTLEAVATFRRAERLPDGPARTCMACLPMYLAFAFDEAKMADSAIVYMQEALTVFDPNRMTDVRDPFMLPIFNRRLGEMYEAKGDRVKAVEHYRKVIEQWKNADPELQVIVNDLRARVRRLTDIEGVPR